RRLTASDAAQRPTARGVLAELAGVQHAVAPEAPFVGRTRELTQLAAAAAAVDATRAVYAHVHGRSGIGKSTLVRRFLDSLGDALVLHGRCPPCRQVAFGRV